MGPQPDECGLLHGSVIKFGLGKPDEDDAAFLGRMTGRSKYQPYPYDVKESKDKLRWEWTISLEHFILNLKAQHDAAIEQVKPRKHEIVQPQEEGYYEYEPTHQTNVPITDAGLNPRPANESAYEQAALASGPG